MSGRKLLDPTAYVYLTRVRLHCFALPKYHTNETKPVATEVLTGQHCLLFPAGKHSPITAIHPLASHYAYASPAHPLLFCRNVTDAN